MWTEDIMAHVARLARPGGTLASFTAAGGVRRDLEAAGFSVERVPGYGRKRQMIRGTRQGGPACLPSRPSRIAVIGGGVAGAAAAAGLRRRGADVCCSKPEAVSGKAHPATAWRCKARD